MTSPRSFAPAPPTRLAHPQWAERATIYQLNTRQFTPQGTFKAAAEHLPRIRDLGATILWLMPVHDIGAHNRKGKLGSPYAVRDYYSVNPDLGSLADLRDFVGQAHELGMYVILDWVANHTAWDNPLATEHPEWYARDWKGDFRPTPWWDWDDVIDLDYDNEDLRRYMTNALTYWVREADIDGYRCDVAGFVPLDFWETARAEMEDIKPVFLLAEYESRDLHVAAFDMSYAWTWSDALHHIAMGRSDLGPLRAFYANDERAWPHDSIRMTFVSNHDKNAWEGTEYEMFGDALHAAIVLSVVGHGMPLIYGGQEAGNDKRLEFFEKDLIEWQEHPMRDLYTKLFTLKRENSALANGLWGARMVNVPNSDDTHVLSFVRQDKGNKVFAVFNFSAQPRVVTCTDGPHHGEYVDLFDASRLPVDAATEFTLEPWAYRVLLGQP
jgi:glycosidase